MQALSQLKSNYGKKLLTLFREYIDHNDPDFYSCIKAFLIHKTGHNVEDVVGMGEDVPDYIIVCLGTDVNCIYEPFLIAILKSRNITVEAEPGHNNHTTYFKVVSWGPYVSTRVVYRAIGTHPAGTNIGVANGKIIFK